jgi:hypothetical protein
MKDEKTDKIVRCLGWCAIALLLALAITAISTYSCSGYEGGTSISTMGCNNFISSDNGETWERTNSNTGYFTVFEFNKEYKFFKHTAEDITSMYLIKAGTFKFDSTNLHMSFQCQSDVGNNYQTDIFFRDDKNTIACVINTWRDDEAMYMVVWYIKSYWINEGEDDAE